MILCFPGHFINLLEVKKQPTVARSSAEAEYRALADITSELLWLKQILRSLHIFLPTNMVLSDSKATIQLATNPTCSDRTKHIDIDCHFIRQHVSSHFLNLIHVSSSNQIADILTTTLPRPLFQQLVIK